MSKLIMLFTLLLASCGIYPNEWEEAERLCSTHSGIAWIGGHMTDRGLQVMCKDRQSFDFEISRREKL